jgi:ribosome-associated protein
VSEAKSARSAPEAGLEIRPGLVIPESELEVRRTRSGGPGGQNVNKVSTRVELRFDIAASGVLDDEQKQRLREQLRGRTSQAGALRVVSQRHRTQTRNEMEARRRLAELVAAALEVPKQRRPTKPSRATQAHRVASKRRRSDAKRARRRPEPED